MQELIDHPAVFCSYFALALSCKLWLYSFGVFYVCKTLISCMLHGMKWQEMTKNVVKCEVKILTKPERGHFFNLHIILCKARTAMIQQQNFDRIIVCCANLHTSGILEPSKSHNWSKMIIQTLATWFSLNTQKGGVRWRPELSSSWCILAHSHTSLHPVMRHPKNAY